MSIDEQRFPVSTVTATVTATAGRRAAGVLLLLLLALLPLGAAPGETAAAARRSPEATATGAAHVPAGFEIAQEARFSEHRNAGGGWDRLVVEPRFQVTRVALVPKHAIDLLVIQRLQSLSHSDAESEESTLTVSGWIDGKSRFDHRLWSFTDAADEGGIPRDRELYEATKLGCCGGEDVHDYYSLTTGRLVGTTTAEAAANIAIPNTPTWRMVAYQGANGQRPPQTPAPIANLLGILSLGSDDGVRRRVAVTAPGIDAWTPRLALRLTGKSEETTRLDLWAANANPSPAGIKGCEVRLVFEDTKTLVVPIAADDFDLAHAVLPAGFQLARLDGAGR
jgi:hypothetical protein